MRSQIDFKVIVTLFAIGVSICPYVAKGISKSAEKDLTLSSSEKVLLDKFKHAMEPYISEDHLKREIYLIRWLRISHFNLQKAEKMLLDDIDWRIKFKIDRINTENWDDFTSEYEYHVQGFDLDDQPIITTDFGRWDFRQAILAGKRDRMLRYIFKMLEDMESAVKKQQDSGKLVTRGVLLIDMDGYNLVQHSCVQCISLYMEMIRSFDTHYPGIYEKVVLVNVPAIFETLLNILKPVMAPETRNMLEVYGANKREWQNYLRSFVHEDQLPLEYGGNMVYGKQKLQMLKKIFMDAIIGVPCVSTSNNLIEENEAVIDG